MTARHVHGKSIYLVMTLAFTMASACARAENSAEVMICQLERTVEYLPESDDFKTDGQAVPLAFKYELNDTSQKGWIRARADTFEYYDPTGIFQRNDIYTLAQNLNSGAVGTIANPDAKSTFAFIFDPKLDGKNASIIARVAGKPTDPSMITHVGNCSIASPNDADREFDRVTKSYGAE